MSLKNIITNIHKKNKFLYLLIFFVIIFTIVFFLYYKNQILYQNHDLTYTYDSQSTLATNTNIIKTSNQISKTQNTDQNATMSVKEDILSQYSKVLLVNLQDKTITFKNENEILEYDLLTTGPNGSFYETPTGVYKINTKTEQHFSSIGYVYMPYSMQFFGNFFIHGIPYYKDGKEVSSQYSGGCIRVDTQKIKEIYEKVNIGDTIVIVKDSFTNNIQEKSAQPNVDQDIINIAQNIDESKMDRILLSLIILEFVNVNKDIILSNGQSIKGLNTLSDIINQNNQEYIEIMSRYIYALNTHKMQKLKAIDQSFLQYKKYDKDVIWSDINNRVLLLNYIKNNKSYLYKKIN